ncbi:MULTISPECIES: hypothetical protein [Pseudonocardia]|nr:hypothetical protein [Pseudonocardia abyssalis]
MDELTDGGVPVMTSVDDEVRRTTVGAICAGVDVHPATEGSA